MIEQKKIDDTQLCEEIVKQYQFLTKEQGLTDTQISERAWNALSTYTKPDVVDLDQEAFDQLLGKLLAEKHSSER
ncbi:MAG: hypothetical protein H7308_08075 [Chthonomonadaceae bacterium]|nr:hypothetical protein [Chthonomonadaceae bacterium]